MAITFSNIGLAEPSTLTKVVASVVIARGSTNEHQEVLVIGDPQSSLGMARVLAAAPASTEFGLAVRVVGGPSSVADLAVRAVFSSTSTDNPVTATPVSTAFVKLAGFSVDSSNSLNIKFDGSTSITIGSIAAGAGRINIGSTAADNVVRAIFSSTSADNPVVVSGNSTVFQGGSPWTVNFAAGFVSSAALAGGSSGLIVRIAGGPSSAADLVMRPVFSSTGADNPVVITAGNSSVTIASIAAGAGRINIGSTAADNVVRALISSTSADNPVNATLLFGGLQSSVAGSSGSSGVLVRPIIDNILTTASTNAFAASTSFSIQSSGAALRSYVVAYSLLSTNAGPHKLKFYSSGTMTWPVIFAAVSSAVSGANLAVSAPAYLFRTAASEALTLQIGSGASTVGGYQIAVSYFRAP